MKNPFEAPRPRPPEEEESVDIDVSEFGAPKPGPSEFTGEEIEARHEAEGRRLAPERAKETAALNAVAEAFFKDNRLLRRRFENDPGAKARLKEGLLNLVRKRASEYQLEPEELPSDPRFLKDLLMYSMEFEDEENARKARGTRAA